MKLAACLVSSDLTPLYLDFFPAVHRAWRQVVGVRAILVLVADELPTSLEAFRSDIVLFPPMAGVHPAFQAQCLRLVAPQLLDTPRDEAVIISDVDMLPMRRDYYVDPLLDAKPDEFVVYRSDAMPRSSQQIIMCYSAAAPAVWGEMFGRASTTDEAATIVRRWNDNTHCSGSHGGEGWGTDQFLLFEGVERLDPKRVRRLNDRQPRFARLDRGSIGTRLSPLQRSLTRRHFYSDYHVKRPNSEFAALNAEILQLVSTGRPQPWPIDEILHRISR